MTRRGRRPEASLPPAASQLPRQRVASSRKLTAPPRQALPRRPRVVGAASQWAASATRTPLELTLVRRPMARTPGAHGRTWTQPRSGGQGSGWGARGAHYMASPGRCRGCPGFRSCWRQPGTASPPLRRTKSRAENNWAKIRASRNASTKFPTSGKNSLEPTKTVRCDSSTCAHLRPEASPTRKWHHR